MIRGGKAKYYVDTNGIYIGAYCGIQKLVGTYEDGHAVVLHPGQEAVVPQELIEVPTGPLDARQKWDADNQVWLPVPGNESTKGE